ncbi:MAG: glycosyltransferase family 2 protein [Verrucomicrobiota bacterium]
MTLAMDPDFTIVTASYNYGRFIGDCLQSVACQDGVTFEHLVIDAGSNDNTAEVVAGFPHASFFQEPDKGMSDGINKGFRKARGKWVMWLNADDRLKPGALKAVKEFAEKNPVTDVIYGAWDFIDVSGNFLRRMGVFPFRKRMLLQYGCYIGSTACFYRRDTIIDRGFLLDIDFLYCMDGDYYARLALAGKHFAYLPLVLADFRLHGESISQANLNASEMEGVLRLQHQIAEVRAIRRVHGWNFGSSRELADIADGLLSIVFRIERILLKSWHARRLRAPVA